MKARLSYNGEDLIITGETRERWEILRNFIIREDQEDGAIFYRIYLTGPQIEGEGIGDSESENPTETVASFTKVSGEEGVIVIKKDLITNWIEEIYYGEENRRKYDLEEVLTSEEKKLIDQLVESKRKAEAFWIKVRSKILSLPEEKRSTSMVWIPYCIDCQKEVEIGISFDRDWASAAARVHREETNHKVIVGFEPRPSLSERSLWSS